MCINQLNLFVVRAGLIFLYLCFVGIVQAQNYGKGLLLNDSKFDNILKLPELSRGNFASLPPKYSLKSFAPEPGNQGSTSTCTGWAVAYGARTILEALKHPESKTEIINNPFSPSFIYNQIRKSSDCNAGSSIIDACETLRDVGVLSLNEFGFDCEKVVSKRDSVVALRNRIKDFQELFFILSKNKVIYTKKSLSENKPVIVGIKCPASFNSAKKLWQPTEADYNAEFGGHAMTIVGYDDNLYGGAFELLNSWSKNWGDGGYCWIKYNDYEKFAKFAIQLIDSLGEDLDIKISGSISLVLENKEKLDLKKDEFGLSSVKAYGTNTLFRLIVNISYPAYFYALSIDSSTKRNVIFPFSEKVSPYIPYNSTSIEIPSENHYFMLDDHIGSTTMLLFFSAKQLDIHGILDEIKIMGPDYINQLFSMLREKYNYPESISIQFKNDSSITFNSSGPLFEVVPIVISILHE